MLTSVSIICSGEIAGKMAKFINSTKFISISVSKDFNGDKTIYYEFQMRVIMQNDKHLLLPSNNCLEKNTSVFYLNCS